MDSFEHIYANGIVRGNLLWARASANAARRYGGGPESMNFRRGLLIGGIQVAGWISGADRDAALSAEHEVNFLLGDYLRRQA